MTRLVETEEGLITQRRDRRSSILNVNSIDSSTGGTQSLGEALNATAIDTSSGSRIRHQRSGKRHLDNLFGCEDSLTTSFTDSLGSFGNIFSIKIYDNPINIFQLDLHTDIVSSVTYDLYTMAGAYGSPLEHTITDWTLLKSGTTTGAGSGQGTPIQGFAPVTIAANSTQSFYVTLSTADIRYRNIETDFPEAKVGDVYLKNNDMEIQIGHSVGSYPMQTSFFGPRVWDGSVHYTNDYACPTSAPSVAPSFITEAPTSEPDFGDCIEKSVVSTALTGTTGAYGNMFTVVGVDEPVKIISMDFHASQADTTVTVKVFTKIGDYKGFEAEPSAWTPIAETSVVSAGVLSSTIIPESAFAATYLFPGETRAFYITIDSPAMRYDWSNVDVGQPVAESKYLKVNSGAGFAELLFGSSTYEPRTFNGNVHYIHSVDCNAAKTVTTQVTYTFFLTHRKDVVESDVLKLANRSVRTSVIGLIQTVPKLNAWVTLDDFEHSKTETSIANIPINADTCIVANELFTCTAIDSQVALNHLDSLPQGDVSHYMLDYRDDITFSLNLVPELQARYIGDIAVTAYIEVTIGGANDAFSQEMDEAEEIYFAAVSVAYYNNELEKMGIHVSGVKVDSQQVQVGGRGGLIRRLQRGPSSSSVAISTTVTGEYTPPPFKDFSQIIDDAIDADPDKFIEDLKTGGEIFLTDDGVSRVRPYWVDAAVVESKVLRTSAPSLAPSPIDGDSNGPPVLIIGVVTGILLVAIVGLFYVWRRTCGGEENKHEAIVNLGGGPVDYRATGLFGKKSSTRGLFDEGNESYVDAEVQYCDAMYGKDGAKAALKQSIYGKKESYPMFGNEKQTHFPSYELPVSKPVGNRSMLSMHSSRRSSGHSGSTKSSSSEARSSGYPAAPEADVFARSSSYHHDDEIYVSRIHNVSGRSGRPREEYRHRSNRNMQ